MSIGPKTVVPSSAEPFLERIDRLVLMLRDMGSHGQADRIDNAVRGATTGGELVHGLEAALSDLLNEEACRDECRTLAEALRAQNKKFLPKAVVLGSDEPIPERTDRLVRILRDMGCHGQADRIDNAVRGAATGGELLHGLGAALSDLLNEEACRDECRTLAEALLDQVNQILFPAPTGARPRLPAQRVQQHPADGSAGPLRALRAWLLRR